MKLVETNVRGERAAAGWLLLAAVMLLAALAAPFFAQRVYVADDLGEFHLPVRDFYARQLAAGESFDWMPSLYGGFYVAGEGQLGAYHPWHWLLYRTLPLGAAFNIELLASYPLLFAGTYLWLARLLRRRDAALVGATAFTFGGFGLLHFIHPNAIAVVAHLPWLLWAIDVALDGDTGGKALRTEDGKSSGRAPSLALRASGGSRARIQPLAVAAIGLLTASQLLLGYPQYVWFSLLAEAGFVLYLMVARGVRPATLVNVALAVVAGALIGAVQWVPTWHLLSESVRKTASTDFANTGSLHPLNLVQLIAPYLFEKRVVGQNTHELGLYLGAVPLVLVVWLLARRSAWGEHRLLIRALLVGLVVSLLLAAGEAGGLYRLQAWLPLVNRFRFPCRAIVLVQLCLAALAAIGAAKLFARREGTAAAGDGAILARSASEGALSSELSTTGEPVGAAVDEPRSNVVTPSLALRASGTRAHVQHAPSPENPNTRRNTALTALIVLALAAAVVGPLVWSDHVASPLLVWSGPALLAAGVLCVLLVERGATGGVALLALFLAADLGAYGLSYSVWGRTADLHAYVAAIPRPAEFAGERVAAPDGADKLRTGDRMLLAGLQRIDGYAGLEPAKQLDYADPKVLAMAGVAWQLVPADDSTRSARTWKRIGPPAPRVRLVTKTLPASELQSIGSVDRSAAICEPQQELPPSEPGTARITSDKPGVMEIKVDAPARQVLATTESFDSGWTASADGRPLPVVRVNGDFLGCVVEPGKHLVRLEFSPRARRVGGRLAMLGLGLLTVAVGLTATHARRAVAAGGRTCVPN